MLSEYEAQKMQDTISRESDLAEMQRLLRGMHSEPAWRLAAAFKCAACLVILAGLAVIGTTADVQTDAPLNTTAGLASPGEPGSDAAADKAYDGVVESGHHPLPGSEVTELAVGSYATVKAEHHRKAVFDAHRRTWEQRSYSADERIAEGRNGP